MVIKLLKLAPQAGSLRRNNPGRWASFSARAGTQRSLDEPEALCRCKQVSLEASCWLCATIYDLKNEGQTAGSALNGLATALVAWVPGFVPRPVAKAALVAVAGSIALSLVQKVLSAAFFVLVAGGAAYLWLKSKGGQGDTQEEEGGDESLADARRIMNKYK